MFLCNQNSSSSESNRELQHQLQCYRNTRWNSYFHAGTHSCTMKLHMYQNKGNRNSSYGKETSWCSGGYFLFQNINIPDEIYKKTSLTPLS